MTMKTMMIMVMMMSTEATTIIYHDDNDSPNKGACYSGALLYKERIE